MSDKAQYELKLIDRPNPLFTRLDQDDWFIVFREGKWAGIPVVWFQPAGDSSKRVTFTENTGGTPV